MTNISKSHQRFSNYLKEPRVLTEPQEFLGPNYEAILDFWLFLDGLTEDQWKTINGRYGDFRDKQWSEWNKARYEAFEASDETIGWEIAGEAAYAASYAAVNAAWGSNVAYKATRELIGMHILLEQQKPLTFFNMFLEP